MEPQLGEWIHSSPEYKEFIRFHPVWYRLLNRNPELIEEFVEESRRYHGQTLPQRLERFKGNMDMALMLLSLMNQK
ncbi:YlbE-like family protein [Bacillus piscicola]|uniref:YlbE-like family protein n=1 Tax=Bacillus piscicola TaxID=1632684 RepID=UPI001F09F59A|nr:YlbE-like family protein [Bacillus piscicola]